MVTIASRWSLRSKRKTSTSAPRSDSPTFDVRRVLRIIKGPASITTQVGGSILFFFLIALTPLALRTSGHHESTVRAGQLRMASRVTAGGAGPGGLKRTETTNGSPAGRNRKR